MIKLQGLVDLAIEAGAARQCWGACGCPDHTEKKNAADQTLAQAQAQFEDRIGELLSLVREARAVMEPESSVTLVDSSPRGWTARAMTVLALEQPRLITDAQRERAIENLSSSLAVDVAAYEYIQDAEACRLERLSDLALCEEYLEHFRDEDPRESILTDPKRNPETDS